MTPRHHTVIATVLAILGLYLMRVSAVEIQPSPEGLIASRAEGIVGLHSWIEQSEHALGGIDASAMSPLLSWTSSLGIVMFGHTPIAVRWFSILCAVLACFMTFSVARRVLTFNNAIVAMICVGTSLPFIVYGRQATTVIPAVALALCALWAVFVIIESKKNFSVLAGSLIYAVALGLTLMSMPLMSILVVAFAVGNMGMQKSRRPLILALVVGLSIGIPWLALMLDRHGSQLFHALSFSQLIQAEATSVHGGPLRVLLLCIEAHPLIAVALMWCVHSVWRRSKLPSHMEPMLLAISLWFVIGLIALALSSARSPLAMALLVPPGIILALFAIETYRQRSNSGLIVVAYGLVAASSPWFVANVVMHASPRGMDLITTVVIVIVGVLLAILGLGPVRRRALIAVKLYKPIVYGVVGLSVLASVLVVVRGSPLSVVGGRAIAAALEEDTLTVHSFVYLYHGNTSTDAMNGQLAWYTDGWMAGRRPGYSYKAWAMPESEVDESVVASVRGASWIVYYHRRIEDGVTHRVRQLLGSQYMQYEESPDYTLFRNR